MKNSKMNGNTRKRCEALDYQTQLQTQQMQHLQEMQNAEHNRRLEAIKLIAGYPPDQQFLLAMQYNPDLQKAFGDMQQARAREDKLEMARQFQEQLQGIYGKQSELSNALLIEAARQLGLILSEQTKSQAPPSQQHVIVHQIPPATSPPATSQLPPENAS